MSDREQELDTAQLSQQLLETSALRAALHAAIERVTVERAAVDGHPVHPDVLMGLLLMEVGAIATQWAMAQHQRPDDITDYFDALLRRVRRGFRVQMDQALQRRIVPS